MDGQTARPDVVMQRKRSRHINQNQLTRMRALGSCPEARSWEISLRNCFTWMSRLLRNNLMRAIASRSSVLLLHPSHIQKTKWPDYQSGTSKTIAKPGHSGQCVSVWYVGCGQSYIIFHPSTTTSNYHNQAASAILGIELEKQGINSRAAISESAWMYLVTLISSEKQWSQHDSSIKPNALEFALGNSCRVCSHVWWELWNGIWSCRFFNTNCALFSRISWGKSGSKSGLIPTRTKSSILKLKLKKLHRFLMHDVPEKPRFQRLASSLLPFGRSEAFL